MLKHHTKSKGDIGLTAVIADLTKKGFQVCLPISEHLPFDLIAVDEKGKLARVQVKYIKLSNGVIEIPLRSVYSNGKGSYAVKHDFESFDGYACYCPDVDTIYYYPISINETCSTAVTLRVSQAMINDKRIRYAENYLSPDKLFVENEFLGKVAERSKAVPC